MAGHFENVRILLRVPPGAYSRAPVEVAFDVARWIGSRIEAALLPDEASTSLAALPFAREFQPLLQTWKALSADRLLSEKRAHEAWLRRQIEIIAISSGAAGELHNPAREQAPGAAKAIGAKDIIAFPAPPQSGEQFIGAYPRLIGEAIGGSSSILILPHAPARRKGPVLAVISNAGAPALGLAARIAKSTNEELVVAQLDRAAGLASTSRARQAPAGMSNRVPYEGDAYRFLLTELRDIGESVIVLSGSLAAVHGQVAPLDVVAARRVPLLIAR